MSKSKCAEGKLKEAHTWSELCQRWFASKAEARRGEELLLLQRTGQDARQRPIKGSAPRGQTD